MSTLDLHFNNTTYRLWTPTSSRMPLLLPQTATIFRPIGGNVYFARMGANHRALKLAFNREEVTNLQREAIFYENDLKDLRGQHVPEYYGIYFGNVEGEEVACMVLEYCESLTMTDLNEYR